MNKLSPLQMTEAISWSGMGTKAHLNKIYATSPQIASKIITKIYAANFGMTTDAYMSETGAVLTLDSDDDYTWRLMGSSKKNLPLVEARINGSPITPTSRCGQNYGEFELVFSEFYFHDQQLIVGHKNEIYSMQILSDPIKEGTNFVYRVRLLTGDQTLFVPFEELVAGKRFSKDWTPVEQTLSKKGSPVDFTSSYDMRNAFTMIRKEQTYPGNTKNRPIGTALKDSKGNKFILWEQYVSYELTQQLNQEKNHALVFATANRSQDGTYKNQGLSGNMVVQGAGLRQQSECSNTEFYTDFNIDLPTNMLVDLSEGKLTSDKRKFIMKTGERGMIKFHKALEDKVHLYTPNEDSSRLYGVAKSGVEMGKGYGGQFIEYKGPNGVVISIEADSSYDNRVRNKIYHFGGGVAESHRFDLFDIGTTNAEPNVRKVVPKGLELFMGIIPGLRNPMDATNNNIMATGVDGWTEHKGCYISGMITDPTKTASLIPDVLS